MRGDKGAKVKKRVCPGPELPTSRYRVSVQDRTEFTSDTTGIVDITRLSDPFVMQDFYQSEFRINPVPDNVVALAKTGSFYSLTGIARYQVNKFFEQTERLPEVVLDIKRTALFGSPIFYEGESSIADLHRNFGDAVVPSPSPSPSPAMNIRFENYSTVRADTFHQLLYPNTYFGWLSIVPRAGFRATYYDETVDLGKTMFTPSGNPLVPDFILPDPTNKNPIVDAGSGVRTVFDTGAEASFKISRTWEDAQSRMLGLDGLLHVFQPFPNFSYVLADGI